MHHQHQFDQIKHSSPVLESFDKALQAFESCATQWTKLPPLLGAEVLGLGLLPLNSKPIHIPYTERVRSDP